MSRRFDDYYFSLPYGVRGDLYEGKMNYFQEMEDPFWKRIPWAENYFVSMYGDVMSIVKGKPHILKPWKTSFGHNCIEIDGRKIYVHRLVAEMFIDNPDDYPIVRHMDDDPSNNFVENLAWGTSYDNRMDCVNHDRDYRRPVYCYETEETFRSCTDAADAFGVHKSEITQCCNGKVNSISGYHLCYLDELDEKMKNPKKWFSKVGNYKPVRAINVATGEELIFDSRAEASEYLNIPDCGISSVVNGRINQTHGWRFENVEY